MVQVKLVGKGRKSFQKMYTFNLSSEVQFMSHQYSFWEVLQPVKIKYNPPPRPPVNTNDGKSICFVNQKPRYGFKQIIRAFLDYLSQMYLLKNHQLVPTSNVLVL